MLVAPKEKKNWNFYKLHDFRTKFYLIEDFIKKFIEELKKKAALSL